MTSAIEYIYVLFLELLYFYVITRVMISFLIKEVK